MKMKRTKLLLLTFFLLSIISIIRCEKEEDSIQEFSKWVRKMSQFDPSPSWIYDQEDDQEEEDANVFEYLGQCEKDEYVVLRGQLRKLGGVINGTGAIEYHDDSHCYHELDIDQVEGTWINGKLEGEVRIEFVHGHGFLLGHFRSGVLSGIVRRFRCKFGDCEYFEFKPWTVPKYLASVVRYSKSGKPVQGSNMWKFKIGGGSLFGTVGEDGEKEFVSDNRGVYLYPDKKTVLSGKFVKDVMISTKSSELTGFTYDGSFIVPIIQQSTANKDIFKYSPSNKTWIPDPLLKDTYEDQYLSVSDSTVKGAGRGVFVRKSVPIPGTVLGFYNGVKMSNLESKLINKETRRSPYRMDNDWANPTEILNMPVKYRDLDSYNATVAHLINHSDKPNAWFAMFDHPRFGKIRSIVSKKPLEKDEEIFIDYGYLKQYQESEEMIQTLLKAGQWISGKKDPGEFHNALKYHVKFVRDKINEAKPYLDMAKNAYDLILK